MEFAEQCLNKNITVSFVVSARKALGRNLAFSKRNALRSQLIQYWLVKLRRSRNDNSACSDLILCQELCSNAQGKAHGFCHRGER